MTTASPILPGMMHQPVAARHASILARWTERRVFLLTMFALGSFYLLLQNPYWVPGGDSEVYIAIAQNLANGNGLMWNGRPVGMVPPGWPFLMVGVMKVWPTFLALKLVTLVSMWLSMGIFYWIVRRFASPARAAGVVLVAGMLSHAYSLTFWLHSDAAFCLATAASLLLAIQISEGRHTWWRITLMLLLCAVAVFIRWAGVLNFILIGAALVRGQWRPHIRVEWTLLVGAALVIVVTFVGTRWGMKKFAPPRVAYENVPQTIDPAGTLEEPGVTSVADAGAVEGSYNISTVAASGGIRGYIARITGWGTWFSYLFWQPLRLAAGWPALWQIANLLGWLIIALLILAAWNDVITFDWLAPAVLIYSLALCVNWTHATARYLVPLAPLIVLGMFRGAEILLASMRGAPRRAAHIAWLHLVAAIVVVNALLYLVDVSVMQSRDFYGRYEAGLTKPLLAAAQFLNANRVGHGQAVINPMYENIGRRRLSPTGLRALTMLTGKALRTVPQDFQKKALPRDRDFRKWIGDNYITFYLDQPIVSPWRIWHYRVAWLQELMTGEPAIDAGAGWRIFRCDGKSLPVRLPRPQPAEYPTRVPGF